MKSLVQIDFQKFSEGFATYVREKAAAAGSTIVYLQDKQLIEEEPASGKQRILQEAPE